MNSLIAHLLMPHTGHRTLFLITLVLACVPVAQGQLANSPPAPQWLAHDSQSVVEKKFEWSGRLLKAVLFVASDSPIKISLNGESLGEIQPRPQAVTVDATKHVRAGGNVLAFESSGRAALLLELNGDLARKQWITTDDTWTASRGKIIAEAVSTEPGRNPFDFSKTFDAYNSWQLAKPASQNQATDPSSITLPPGFRAELIRSSSGDEGSWVSMTFDPQGRITLGREKRGLLRFDPRTKSVEVINDTLLECRGLLYAFGALYANANNSKGLYRLRSTKNDGTFDEVTEIMHTEGGVGHGRNHVKAGPDGKLYVIHGNNVLLPSPIEPNSPLQNYAPDQLIPNPWDSTMFDGNVELPAGHLLRLNPDGSHIELVAGGMRNPLDIAFNRDGELFTFDADMERDVGTAWYMPTRILHLVPGADFGWRRGTGRFPAWYPDTLPSVVDIGLSSPTGIFFGYGAKFPAKYRESLFLLDWAYGRIIAVTLKPKGASYTGTQETFASGRPLNVTDGCIGPDGALWFTTGGRGTQSGLYRITYRGGIKEEAVVQGDAASKAAREKRHKLEQLLKADKLGDDDLGLIMSGLESEDRIISGEARLVFERFLQAGKVKGDLQTLLPNPRQWVNYLLALAHVADQEQLLSEFWGVTAHVVPAPSERPQLPSVKKAASEKVPLYRERLRVLEVYLSRHASENQERRREWIEELKKEFKQDFPTRNPEIDRELCKLLVYLKSPNVIAKTTELLRTLTASEDLVQYPMLLRYVKDGWTLEQRRIVFDALNRAEKLNGASTYFKAIADIRSEMAAQLSAENYQKLADVINPPKPVQLLPHAMPGHTFKNWTMEDLIPQLDKVSKGRNHASARAALIAAQCVFCHRVSNDPSLPAGVFGPDLTQVSARFSRRDLLEQIINPSKIIDEKYRSTILTLADGKQISGTLESEDDERVTLKPNPLALEKIETAKGMIKARKLSDVSPMPVGLLNALKADQILDILAWFEAGGDPKHKVFQ